jgi:hypothetical protein
MQDLETLLRARLMDSRAMTAVLNINIDRVFLDFGQIGEIPRVRLRIKESEVEVVYPEDARLAWQKAEASKGGGATAPSGMILATEDDGRLFAPSGAEIHLPVGLVVVREEELEAVLAQAGQSAAENGPLPVPGGVAPGEPDPPGRGAEIGAAAVSPDDMSRDDLVALAAEEGVAHGAKATKAEIAEAINAARGVA